MGSKQTERRKRNQANHFRTLFEEHKGVCCFCGCQVWFHNAYIKILPKTLKRTIHNQASKDHVIPKRFGGTNEITNLRLACKHCNSIRSHYSFDIFSTIRNFPSWREIWIDYQNVEKTFDRLMTVEEGQHILSFVLRKHL